MPWPPGGRPRPRLELREASAPVAGKVSLGATSAGSRSPHDRRQRAGRGHSRDRDGTAGVDPRQLFLRVTRGIVLSDREHQRIGMRRHAICAADHNAGSGDRTPVQPKGYRPAAMGTVSVACSGRAVTETSQHLRSRGHARDAVQIRNPFAATGGHSERSGYVQAAQSTPCGSRC